MKFHPRGATAALFVVALGVSTVSNAALYSRLGGQAVYDSDLNITWLTDADLAASMTFGVSGINAAGYMGWTTAQSWIGAMNTANYLGYNDWRLPTTVQPDSNCSDQSGGVSSGSNCTGSEMGHLFYSELSGVGGQSITTNHNSNFNLFQNFQSWSYWSGTEYPPINGASWYFNFSDGTQLAASQDSSLYALAVRPGDVAAVPIPAAAWLFGSGLLGLLGMARCQARG